MKRVLGLAVLFGLGLFAAVPLAVLASGSETTTVATPDSTPIPTVPFTGSRPLSRIEKVFQHPTGYQCDLDACGGGEGLSLGVPTPTRYAKVDIVVTASFTYRTSRGDAAVAELEDVPFIVPPCPAGGCGRILVAPGAYKLASPSGYATSTTLTWIKKAAPASGLPSIFRFSVAARDGNDDQRASVTARRVTVVAEVWTSGD
jgi:hypothetical protein